MATTTTTRRAAKGRTAKAGKAAKAAKPQPRQRRSDRRDAGQKFSFKLSVKLTPAGGEEIHKSARQAGYESAAEYLRALATADRSRLVHGHQLAAFDFNTPDGDPAPKGGAGGQ